MNLYRYFQSRINSAELFTFISLTSVENLSDANRIPPWFYLPLFAPVAQINSTSDQQINQNYGHYR